MPDSLAEQVRARIRDVPDFPKPGIVFKDLTPVLSDPLLFAQVINWMEEAVSEQEIDHVVAMEARGFIYGAPIALDTMSGFIPVRKPGKLPFEKLSVEYQLEYGVDSLEAHADAIKPGERILIVDDLLATGGTAAATVELVRRLGGDVIAAVFVVELGFLDGRKKLDGVPVHTLVRYD